MLFFVSIWSCYGAKTIADSKWENILPLGKILLLDDTVFSSVKFCIPYRHTISTGIEKSYLKKEKLLLLRFPMHICKNRFPMKITVVGTNRYRVWRWTYSPKVLGWPKSSSGFSMLQKNPMNFWVNPIFIYLFNFFWFPIDKKNICCPIIRKNV